jgi:hypothetical protein
MDSCSLILVVIMVVEGGYLPPRIGLHAEYS